MSENPGAVALPPAPSLISLLEAIGRHLGFDVATEVEASESAWVDVVWFDRRQMMAEPPKG